jgi:hypothetical protein
VKSYVFLHFYKNIILASEGHAEIRSKGVSVMRDYRLNTTGGSKSLAHTRWSGGRGYPIPLHGGTFTSSSISTSSLTQ